MRKCLIIICLLLLGQSLLAATDTLRLGYSADGKVVDAATGRALESVLVTIPGRRHSTVTNADGVFTLKSDSPFNEVAFSFLGYRADTLKAGEGMKVRLRNENLKLDAASIISGNPEKNSFTFCHLKYSGQN